MQAMNNRWWIFLVGLWTVALVTVVPFLFSPMREGYQRVVNPCPGVTSITLYDRRPFLDWTGRLKRYELEVMVNGKASRFPWPGSNWTVSTGADGRIQVTPVPATGAAMVLLD